MAHLLVGSEVEENLILKAYEGDEDAVAAILDEYNKVAIVSVDDFRVKGLVTAAQNGHAALARRLVVACPDNVLDDIPLLSTKLDMTMLHIAAWTGQHHKIPDLIARDSASLTAKTQGGFTALHLACSTGCMEVVELLLQRPETEVTCQSEEGLTALHLAAAGGHLREATAVLAACGEPAELVKVKDSLGRTALHHAARRGHASLVQLLLDASQPWAVELVLERDRVRESTAFLLAAMMPGDHVDVVRILLEKDHTQVRALVGDPKLAEADLEVWETVAWKVLRPQLVDKADAASVRAKFSEDDYSVNHGDDDADRLKARGVSIAGQSALHLAASQDNVRVVGHLLEQPDMDVNAPDHDFGMTPLHCAVRTGALRVIKALLKLPQKKLDVNAELLSGGPCPDMRDVTLFEDQPPLTEGDTALHLATLFGTSSEALQSAKALCKLPHLSTDVRNSDWRTPLEIAFMRWRAASGAWSPEAEEVAKFFAPDRIFSVIAEHPSSQVRVDHLKERKQELQNSLNAMLVGQRCWQASHSEASFSLLSGEPSVTIRPP